MRESNRNSRQIGQLSRMPLGVHLCGPGATLSCKQSAPAAIGLLVSMHTCPPVRRVHVVQYLMQASQDLQCE